MSPAPPLTGKGMPKNKYVCYEGDLRCDIDGTPDNNSCTVAANFCINNEDSRFPDCLVTAIDAFQVKKPSSTSLDPVDNTNLLALESAAGGGGMGVSILRQNLPFASGARNLNHNMCTGTVPILVPLKVTPTGKRLTGRRSLKIQVTAGTGFIDTDSVKIQCKPSTCGNGITEVDHEACDDGNRINGDGCDQGCQIEVGPPTPTATRTSTNVATPTRTPTATQSGSPTNTLPPTATFTKTNTATITPTPTRTQTATRTETPTRTETNTRTPTITATPSRTNTPTQTPTITITPTPTSTRTNTPSVTPTFTPTLAPDVFIDSPTHGSFSTLAIQTVDGHVTNPVPGNILLVNGTQVNIEPDNTFSFNLPLSASAIFNPVVAELQVPATGFKVRERRVVIRGQSVADGAVSTSAIALRINDTGFDKLEPVVAALAGGSLNPQSLLPAGSFLGDFSVPILGTAHAYVDTYPPDGSSQGGVSLQSFSVNVDAQAGFTQVDVTLNGLEANLDLTGSITCGLRVNASTVTIRGNYDMIPLASDPEKLDVNQISDVTLLWGAGQPTHSWTYGICNTLSFLVDALVDVDGQVKSQLASALKDPDGAGPQDAPIAGALQGALGGLALGSSISAGLGVNLYMPFTQVDADVNGDSFEIGVSATSPIHPVGAPDFTRSLVIAPEPFPAYGANTPGGRPGTDVTSTPYHLALGLSATSFNQLLKSLTEKGILNITLTEIALGGGSPITVTSDVLGVFIPEFFDLPAATPLKIDIIPTVSPIVTGLPGPAGELEELKLSQLLINISAADGSVLYLSVAVDVRTGINFSYSQATNALAILLGAVNSNDITTVILENGIHTDESNLQGVVPLLVQQFLPSLTGGLGSIPLPALFGLSPGNARVNKQGTFMSIYLDFV